MDVDVAIKDIFQMRQGFISYVNEHSDGGQPLQEEAHQRDLEQILDPSKFIERHFGSENPDIVFQEVLKEIPEPPKAIQQPAREAEMGETIEEAIEN